ncbi:YciK family oxidoreductase [Gilvimarinus sp. F26214L]|uniref:YciK family oxidoreductase n=1 Tax=Gilvimarinus sp. DZF01 TaxID=3461371 RepID=UPI00404661DD
MASIDPLNYTAPADLLGGKTIAVTGAGDGIGRTAALTFAAHGATVILLGRTVKKLEAVYDEIEKEGHSRPAIYPIDFSGAQENDYKDMAAAFEKEFGRLDGILHNAGELGPRTPLSQYPEETWQRVLQVNATAPFLMTKALLGLLEKSGQASVVFTGSSVGYHGRAYWGAYAVSKAAVENTMQIFAAELTETTGIRFNSINPGATRTRMRALAYPAEDPRSLKTPEDIMGLYLYLMGRDSADCSGQQFQAQPKV